MGTSLDRLDAILGRSAYFSASLSIAMAGSAYAFVLWGNSSICLGVLMTGWAMSLFQTPVGFAIRSRVLFNRSRREVFDVNAPSMYAIVSAFAVLRVMAQVVQHGCRFVVSLLPLDRMGLTPSTPVPNLAVPFARCASPQNALGFHPAIIAGRCPLVKEARHGNV